MNFFQLPQTVLITLHGSFRTPWQRKMQSTEKGLWSSWMLSTQILCIIDYASSFLTFFLFTMLCGPGPFVHCFPHFPSAASELCFIFLSLLQHCFPLPLSQSDIPHISCGEEKLTAKTRKYNCVSIIWSLSYLSLSLLSLLGKQTRLTT